MRIPPIQKGWKTRKTPCLPGYVGIAKGWKLAWKVQDSNPRCRLWDLGSCLLAPEPKPQDLPQGFELGTYALGNLGFGPGKCGLRDMRVPYQVL